MNTPISLPHRFRASFGLWFVAAIFTLLTLFFLFAVFFQSAVLESWLLTIFFSALHCIFGLLAAVLDVDSAPQTQPNAPQQPCLSY